jgi:hypothetical protein
MARLVSVALLALCACSPAAERPAEWALTDGRAVVDLSDADDAYVALIMDPGDVFTCAGTLTEWLEWRRPSPERFRLVFTRAPSRAERRRLSTVRLPLAGTLAAAPPDSTPIEMLVSGGRIVHLGRGVRVADQSRLLGPLRWSPIEAVASGMENDGPETLSHGAP